MWIWSIFFSALELYRKYFCFVVFVKRSQIEVDFTSHVVHPFSTQLASFYNFHTSNMICSRVTNNTSCAQIFLINQSWTFGLVISTDTNWWQEKPVFNFKVLAALPTISDSPIKKLLSLIALFVCEHTVLNLMVNCR